MKWSKPIVFFVALAYLISWIVFVLLALNHHHLIFLFPDDKVHARLQDLWHSTGGLGPILAALLTFRVFYNREARRQFRSGYSVKKLTRKGWLLSFSPLLIFAVSLAATRIIQHKWFDFSDFFQNNHLTQPANLLAWSLPILFYGFGEEGGWRGYALPALQTRYSAFRSTVILSVIWVCWHIPSFFYRYDLKGMAYTGFVLGIFAGAIWLTFLFNYTKGSILAVSLWHLAFNFVSMTGKDEVVLSAIMSVLVMALAAFVLIRYRGKDLSPFQRSSLQTASASLHTSVQTSIGPGRILTSQPEKKGSG